MRSQKEPFKMYQMTALLKSMFENYPASTSPCQFFRVNAVAPIAGETCSPIENVNKNRDVYINPGNVSCYVSLTPTGPLRLTNALVNNNGVAVNFTVIFGDGCADLEIQTVQVLNGGNNGKLIYDVPVDCNIKYFMKKC